MFVRFRQSARRLQLSLVETRRDGHKVRHEHIASLGAVPLPAEVVDRVEFWQRLFQRLGRLANRLDDALQAKILEAVHARVPMLAQDEQRALLLAYAQQHERAWRMRHLRTEATVEENKVRLKSAQRLVAEALPTPVT
jgi:hypothetical protein